MIWCHADDCECHLPACAEHGCMGRTGPCDYCGNGKSTGLPGNACENCMNSGLRYPEKQYPPVVDTGDELHQILGEALKSARTSS